jgi:hypothetical protein
MSFTKQLYQKELLSHFAENKWHYSGYPNCDTCSNITKHISNDVIDLDFIITNAYLIYGKVQ